MQINFKEFSKDIKKYIKPSKKPYIIGIAGGSGSGKSLIAKKIAQTLNSKELSMDNYINGNKIKKTENWDLPGIWNLNLIKKNLDKLKKGESIEKPVYNFSKHCSETVEHFIPSKIIILEGLYALHPLLRSNIDLKIFIEADEKTRLQRRINRDTKERGRLKEKIIEKWNKTVQPTFIKYILPEKQKADLIITNN